MVSEFEAPLSPLLKVDEGEQLVVVGQEEVTAELLQRMKATITRTNLILGQRHAAARFTYREIVEFAADQHRSPQEAGKIFSRFYGGLKELDVEPPRGYEFNRDRYRFPLSLLGAVISQMPENQDDAYDKLLRDYYTKRLGSLLVKASTST